MEDDWATPEQLKRLRILELAAQTEYGNGRAAVIASARVFLEFLNGDKASAAIARAATTAVEPLRSVPRKE